MSTDSDSASTSLRSASSPRSLSAGGQEEQPWLVKSSMTARGSAAAGVFAASPASVAAARKDVILAVKAHQSKTKQNRAVHPTLAEIMGKPTQLRVTIG